MRKEGGSLIEACDEKSNQKKINEMTIKSILLKDRSSLSINNCCFKIIPMIIKINAGL